MTTKRATTATRRTEPTTEPEPMPTADEIRDAFEAFRTTAHLARVASDQHTEARRAVVEILHRAGLHGVVL
jgi:hypothetical protein